MDPVPLPPQPFSESLFQLAYQRCLDLEHAAQADLKTIPGCPPPLVCARLLGHLLRLAPTSNARGQLQREITSAENDIKLMELAQMYFKSFIRAFKRSSGPTPAPSLHPSRPSFEDARAYTMEVMPQGQLDHRKARDAALIRSDYCCMITGWRSIDHKGIAYVQAAHVIPEALSPEIDACGKKHFYSDGVWTILSMFMDVDVILQLAGSHIHRLENIILMCESVHHLFDDLRIWFKPVEDFSHEYHICLVNEEFRKPYSIPETIMFTTKTELPLPYGPYLALHALCCEVAWMSGAAEHVMDIERKTDSTRVLANDGSTADLLASVLAHALVH